MHDQMFARAIVSALDGKFGAEGSKAAVIVTVELAPTTHVTEKHLRDAFAAMLDARRFPSLTLVVEHRKLQIKCNACGATNDIGGPVFACPSCESSDFKLLDCDDFAVKSVRVGKVS